MKYSKYQWPTNAATIKYVDRGDDKLLFKIERLQKSVSACVMRLIELEAKIRLCELALEGEDEKKEL